MFCRKKVAHRTNLTMTGITAVFVLALSLCVCSYSYAAEAKISKESVELLTRIGQATAEIVDAVRPAVVNIATTQDSQTPGRG